MDAVTENKTLFSSSEEANIGSAAPLATRMRPRNLAEFIGQRHFLGSDKLLARMLEADRLSSLIFYGPPGVGKTALTGFLVFLCKHLSYKSMTPISLSSGDDLIVFL